MDIRHDAGTPGFSDLLPVYNWFYPLASDQQNEPDDPLTVFDRLPRSTGRTLALYLHIPFCSSICSFCTFLKKKSCQVGEIEDYVEALIREISLKASFPSVNDVPVRAIFFGGGTPSILSPEQILRIGRVIKTHFDLSQMIEFSFEMSPLHVEPAKLDAMQSIGVTHARFGVQTFSPFYRRVFHLTSTPEQIGEAASLLPTYFNRVSFDMLYGMHGQNDEEFFGDLDGAVSLGLDNMAFYPINNAAVQPSLHEAILAAGRQPTTGVTKFYMNVIIKRFMHCHGYLPHNGHEYVRVSQREIDKAPVVTDTYSFVYHEHVYGYANQEVLGFGANAVSRVNEYVVNNVDSIDRYVKGLLHGRTPIMTVKHHSRATDEGRGIILRLPYHGRIQKKMVVWEHIDAEVLHALEELISAGFVRDTKNTLELTEHGWRWYVNLMYYLSPPEEKRIIDAFVAQRRGDANRILEDCRVTHVL